MLLITHFSRKLQKTFFHIKPFIIRLAPSSRFLNWHYLTQGSSKRKKSSWFHLLIFCSFYCNHFAQEKSDWIRPLSQSLSCLFTHFPSKSFLSICTFACHAFCLCYFPRLGPLGHANICTVLDIWHFLERLGHFPGALFAHLYIGTRREVVQL